MNVVDFYPNQDPKIIQLYEIIGSYFTDIIFNHIYINTKTRLTKEASFIDEYIRRLQLYMLGIKNDSKCYQTVISELHKYYGTITSNIISINSFIETIVKTCVPISFIKELTIAHNNEIVSNIICNLVTNLIIYASTPEIIKCIIDNHNVNAKETIRKLQDYAVQIMINKKISILNKFIKESGQVVEEDISHIEIINELKQNITKLVKDKRELIDIIRILEETNTQQKEQINELSNKEKKLRKLIVLINNKSKIITPIIHTEDEHIEPLQHVEVEKPVQITELPVEHAEVEEPIQIRSESRPIQIRSESRPIQIRSESIIIEPEKQTVKNSVHIPDIFKIEDDDEDENNDEDDNDESSD